MDRPSFEQILGHYLVCRCANATWGRRSVCFERRVQVASPVCADQLVVSPMALPEFLI